MKKVLYGLSGVALAVASVPLFAAFEAHVINVTARIENALAVTPTEIRFGTVFPEERLDQNVTVELSGSFREEQNADDVNYIIRQKPKCAITRNSGEVALLDAGTASGHVTVDITGRANVDCGNPPRPMVAGEVWGPLPLLCPYLSKHPIRSESDPSANDGSLDAFHPIGSINTSTGQWVWNDVPGRLAKSDRDVSDQWNIDLKVPCFKGQCAQDDVIPADYELDPTLEHKIFGCDLWVEVTGVSRVH